MTDANTPRTLAELQRLAVPLDAVVVTRQAYEQLRTGLVAAPTPAEPLNTILQAIVQHCSDANMTFDDLRVLNRLIEKVEQAAAPTPAEPLDMTLMRKTMVSLDRILDGPRPRQWPLADQIAAQYNRLAAARPDTPASAEQPGLDVDVLAEAGANVLDGRRIGSVRLYRNTITPDDWQAIAAEYARLAASPSPEPEGLTDPEGHGIVDHHAAQEEEGVTRKTGRSTTV
jgi:hypothetical protein